MHTGTEGLHKTQEEMAVYTSGGTRPGTQPCLLSHLPSRTVKEFSVFKLASLARSGVATLAECALPGYVPAPPSLAPSEAVRPPSYFSPSAASQPPAILAQPSASRALTALHRESPLLTARRHRLPVFWEYVGFVPELPALPLLRARLWHVFLPLTTRTRRGLRKAFPLPTREMGAASPNPMS